jgi:hypothetical protein
MMTRSGELGSQKLEPNFCFSAAEKKTNFVTCVDAFVKPKREGFAKDLGHDSVPRTDPFYQECQRAK